MPESCKSYRAGQGQAWKRISKREAIDCPHEPHHLPVIVFTCRARDIFRQRFWVYCWACSLRCGPYPDAASAEAARHRIKEGEFRGSILRSAAA